ncbi:MAG: hypothetical protein JRJ49_01870 [Deltaproteobacteria bacterium]|nr:hypothetical protein [Deltaproteobacteria bacterium]
MKKKSINKEARRVIDGYQPIKGKLDRNNPPGRSSSSQNANLNSNSSKANSADKK